MNNDLKAFAAYATHHILRITLTTALIAVVISLTACSTLENSSDGWRVNFFKNPDSVWAAIELSLLELDYEVIAKNRPDGTIRAESKPADNGAVIALAIDQVMRTENEVSVYVTPSFAGGGGSANPDVLKAAADEFVKSLERTLNG
jgi:hypothetical protein